MPTATLATPPSAAAATQRADALANANQIRSERARTKRHLASMRFPASLRLAADLLSEPPPRGLECMPVGPLLLACRGMGIVKLRRLLTAASVHESRNLGQLTDAQRYRLIGALRMAAA